MSVRSLRKKSDDINRIVIYQKPNIPDSEESNQNCNHLLGAKLAKLGII